VGDNAMRTHKQHTAPHTRHRPDILHSRSQGPLLDDEAGWQVGVQVDGWVASLSPVVLGYSHSDNHRRHVQ
jgi:hypothetical protein